MASGVGYLPLLQKDIVRRESYFKLPFGKLAWITVSLPLCSFIFCVVWSIVYDFEESTFTHCAVPNFLPSISAAIGSFYPQRYVWNLAIAMHAGPRLMVASMYYKYYLSILSSRWHYVAKIACWLNVIENLALIGLTFISSADNYAIHEKCFITFMVTSEVYMSLTCYLLRSARNIPPSNVESLSLRMKWKLVAVNVISFLAAAYLFVRHNMYCEPWVYSAFAFCEYIVVLTNMAFHMTAYWDFHDRHLLFHQYGFTLS
ncbi:post-GPI attachment to proteins factor 2-like [Ischnura elegans]|uniref:post-GPI attachment to proteins factor 2-like n=1 Tax=Ischnura elegans TaxID=197161 RepID=UPI001ED86ED0|nr:post-GPI attachment to proteins factor 2-like [Ischnura elegans]